MNGFLWFCVIVCSAYAVCKAIEAAHVAWANYLNYKLEIDKRNRK